MNRRNFLSAFLALPFLGMFKRKHWMEDTPCLFLIETMSKEEFAKRYPLSVKQYSASLDFTHSELMETIPFP